MWEWLRKKSFYRTITLWRTIVFSKDNFKNYELQFSPDYWIVMEKRQKLNLWFKEKTINTKNKFNSLNKSTSNGIEILTKISLEIIISIVLVSLFQIIDMHYGFYKLVTIDLNVYSNILTTLAQISGVFIGLYITAISVVLSTAYVKVPENVRSLFLNQTMGKYPKIVAILGSISLLLLLFNSLKMEPSILNLILVILLGIISIFTFLHLVLIVFKLFNPSGLVDYLTSELVDIIKSVTIEGSKWKDPIIQSQCQQKAENFLKMYYDIVNDMAVNKELEGDSINKLTYQVIDLLTVYYTAKNSIPIDSQWFKLNPEYPNWLAINGDESSQIDLAVETKTSLKPDNIPDHFWFEKQIEIIINFSINNHLYRNELKSAASLIKFANNAIIILSRKSAFTEALNLFHMFNGIVELKSKGEYNSKSLKEREKFHIKVSLVDMYATCFVAILISFHEYFRLFQPEYFSQIIENINWNDEKSLYQNNFPLEVLKQLKHIQKRLNFEQEVEGTIISPFWYQNQLAALGFVRFFESTIDVLIIELEENYKNNLNTLIYNKQFVFAAQFIQRGLEICDKFDIDSMNVYFNKISKLRQVKDIPWPEINWNNYKKRIDNIRKHFLIILAEILPEISQIPFLDNLPDYFGQSYIFIAEECYNSLLSNDKALFQKLFPAFFFSSIIAPQKISELEKKYIKKDLDIIKIEPLLNLIELSSYSIIFSELYENDFWDISKSMWDEYLENAENPESIIKLTNDLTNYHIFKITQPQLMRTAWSQKLIKKIKEHLGLSEYYMFDDVNISYPNPIIQYLLRNAHYMNMKLIFLAEYIIKRPEAQYIEIDRRNKSYIDYLAKEKSKK